MRRLTVLIIGFVFIFWGSALAQEQPQMILQLGHSHSITKVAVNASGNMMASLDKGGNLLVWDLKKQKIINDLSQLNKKVSDFRWKENKLECMENKGVLFTYSPFENSLITNENANGQQFVFVGDNMAVVENNRLQIYSDPANRLATFTNKDLGFSERDSLSIQQHYGKLHIYGSNENLNVLENSFGEFKPLWSEARKDVLLYGKNENNEFNLLSSGRIYLKSYKKKYYAEPIDEISDFTSVSITTDGFFAATQLGRTYFFKHKDPFGKIVLDNFRIRYFFETGIKDRIGVADDRNIYFLNTSDFTITNSFISRGADIVCGNIQSNPLTCFVATANGNVLEVAISPLSEPVIHSLYQSDFEFRNGWEMYPYQLIVDSSFIQVSVFNYKVKMGTDVIAKSYFTSQLINRITGEISVTELSKTSENFKTLNEAKKYFQTVANLASNQFKITHRSVEFIQSDGDASHLFLYPLQLDKPVFVRGDKYFCSKKSLEAISYNFKGYSYSSHQFDYFYNDPGYVFNTTLRDKDFIELLTQARIKRLKAMGRSEEIPVFNAPDYNLSWEILESTSADQRIQFHLKPKKLVDSVVILINEVKLNSQTIKNIQVHQDYSKELIIPVIQGENVVSFDIYFSNERQRYRENILLKAPAKSKPIKPNLYVIAIGVSDYLNSDFDLEFAAKDAQDVGAYFKKMKRSNGFQSVYTRTFVNEKVNESILDSIQSFTQSVLPHDVVILYFAGHGVLDDKFNYYLAGHKMDFANPSLSGIAYDQFVNAISANDCLNKVVMLDACHSGELNQDDIKITSKEIAENTSGQIKFRKSGNVNLQVDASSKSYFEMYKLLYPNSNPSNGLNVISSSSGVEFSMEKGDLKNGVFTFYLLQGLKDSDADANQDGFIQLNELFFYIKTQVANATAGIQNPELREENLKSNPPIR